MENFIWDTTCPGVGELDEGAFSTGPEFFSFSWATPLWPNCIQMHGKQQKGPVHFIIISLLAVSIPVKICPLVMILAVDWCVLTAHVSQGQLAWRRSPFSSHTHSLHEMV